MPVSKTATIADFQRRVHAMETTRARELRLTAQEARNLSLEINQLLTELIEQSSNGESVQVVVSPNRF